MRTTINLSENQFDVIEAYIKFVKPHQKINMTLVIDKALTVALPILFEHLPRENESEKDSILRYISFLETIKNNCSGLAYNVIISELAKIQMIAFEKKYITEISLQRNDK